MVTERERAAAKWVRRFEEVNEEELQLAYKICEKILKIRDYRKSWEILQKISLKKEDILLKSGLKGEEKSKWVKK